MSGIGPIVHKIYHFNVRQVKVSLVSKTLKIFAKKIENNHNCFSAAILFRQKSIAWPVDGINLMKPAVQGRKLKKTSFSVKKHKSSKLQKLMKRVSTIPWISTWSFLGRAQMGFSARTVFRNLALLNNTTGWKVQFDEKLDYFRNRNAWRKQHNKIRPAQNFGTFASYDHNDKK